MDVLSVFISFESFCIFIFSHRNCAVLFCRSYSFLSSFSFFSPLFTRTPGVIDQVCSGREVAAAGNSNAVDEDDDEDENEDEDEGKDEDDDDDKDDDEDAAGGVDDDVCAGAVVVLWRRWTRRWCIPPLY